MATILDQPSPSPLPGLSSSTTTTTTTTTAPTQAQLCAARLHNRTLHIPNLPALFATWPQRANKHQAQLTHFINSLLDKTITTSSTTSPHKLQALKDADFARLVSLWYPDQPWRELRLAAVYSLWIFIWDDEVDAGDSEVSSDARLAERYALRSRAYCRLALGLQDDDDDEQQQYQAPPENMRLFEEVGRDLALGMEEAQRKRFLHELEDFMHQVGVEHIYRLQGKMPSTTVDYARIRAGSVGCAPQIALTEYLLQLRLAPAVRASAAMDALWRETVVLCLVLNDVYSVQKEIAQGSLFNLVPTLFYHLTPAEQQQQQRGAGLDAVTAQFMTLLRDAMQGFEDAAAALLGMDGNGDEKEDVVRFIEWCRCFITGIVAWSLESSRYGMAECVQPDGSLRVVL